MSELIRVVCVLLRYHGANFSPVSRIEWLHPCRKSSSQSSKAYSLIYLGSPLSRSWNLLMPHPTQPDRWHEFERSEQFVLAIRAISTVGNGFERFIYANPDSLPPQTLRMPSPYNAIAQDLSSSFRRLSVLVLHITPEAQEVRLAHGLKNPLGPLPELLGSMVGLRDLYLNLNSAENYHVRHDKSYTRQFQTQCYAFNDVFPPAKDWPRLRQLGIVGLSFHGLDLWHLVAHQAPGLTGLSLAHIDLTEGRWEGVVECLRNSHRFQYFALKGIFRHQNGEWWPFAPDRTKKIWDEFFPYCAYCLKKTRRHPSLSADCEDSAARQYAIDLARTATPEQRSRFGERLLDLAN